MHNVPVTSKASGNINPNYGIAIMVWLYGKDSVNISFVTTDEILLDLCLTVIKCDVAAAE